ncbi:MAG: ATP-binding cassette domain-containing protein, partial [Desulfamplus sp.]|nr:ATP-binding cassette domain-containing protein [Desulfamplus sp.]
MIWKVCVTYLLSAAVLALFVNLLNRSMIWKISTRYLLCAAIFSLFINMLNLTVPLYMLSLFTRVLQSHIVSTFYSLTLIAILALLVSAILELMRSRLLIQAGIKINEMLNQKVLQATLEDLSRADNSGYRQGIADLATLQRYFSGNAISALFDIPWIFIYLAIMFLMHPLLGAAASCGAIIVLIMGFLQKRGTQGYIRKTSAIKNRDSYLLQKSSRASEMVKSMGMSLDTAHLRNRIDDQKSLVQDEPERKEHLFGAVSAAFTLFMKISILGVGALLILNHECNIGIVFAASIIMGQALSPVNQSIFALKEISEASVAYANLKTLLSSSKKDELKHIDKLAGKIALKGAGLDLRGKTVLDDINFHLNEGEMMGLVGHNGAGKSCLCRMILGVWLPSRGSVCIDDQETSTLDQNSLGALIGYLP